MSKDYMVNRMEKPAVRGFIEVDGKKVEVWVPNFRLGKKKAIEVFTEWVDRRWKREEEKLAKEIRSQLKTKKRK